MTHRISILTLTAILVFAGVSTTATAAAPAPAWQIVQASYPTVLPLNSSSPSGDRDRGGPLKFQANITNIGGAQAEPGTIIDTVSAGARPSLVQAAKISYTEEVGGKKELAEAPCVTSGQTVTCQLNVTTKPGDQVILSVPLDISGNAPEMVSNEVVVSSTGSSPATNILTSKTGTGPGPFSFVPGTYGQSISASDEAGGVPPAGSHPFMVEISLHVPTSRVGNVDRPTDPLRALDVTLPPGFIADPTATGARCALSELNGGIETPATGCSPEAQVGTASFEILSGLALTSPVFNMVPPKGVAAEFAFSVEKAVVHVQGSVDSAFHLTAGASEIITKYPISGVVMNLWGDPSDPRHDYQRTGVGYPNLGCTGNPREGCPIPPAHAPFLTMPTSCQGQSLFGSAATGWLGGATSQSVELTDVAGAPIQMTGCNQLAFAPTIESKATTNQSESPSGLEFEIHQPQDESLGGRATAPLENATVTLPEGVTLNPSAANGLSSCTEEQMGYAPEEGKIRFQTIPQTCPAAAKVGTLEVTTPLLDHKLPGAIYVAKPFQNPSGSLLAIYLAVEDEEAGIIAKLAGKVEPDPATGRLTATFTENPELPIEDIKLHFFNGAGGVLTTPLTCGTKTTTSTLTPWSTPEGVDAHPSDSFETTAGCSSSEGAAPKEVAFTAGTQSPLSGAYSPFVLRLSRKDGTQHITGIDTTLPSGLLGKLAGVSYCPESAIAQARSREVPEKGKDEIASPSCPSSSEVGKVNVTAGSGISPIPVSGHAYLAGPYKGAPLSLVVIVPAVAGPFDLGTVVDRVALNVGEYDARIHAVADPLPTIRAGIPLDVRSIELTLDRPSFTLNPTSCQAMAIEGTVSTQAGQSAQLKNRFQVGECGRLAFKPKLQISLKGQTRRTGHPALKAVVSYPKGGAYANIASAQVNLPHSEFLDQGNIGKACTKVLLAQRACPARSVYGKVKAWTPLLDKPLEGPVYLVGGYGYKLPALVAELDGQIRVLLVGKVDTGKNKGIRNTFEAVPDAPVERFVLELKGGKKYGLLENSENICKKKQVAGVSFTAQNGKALQLSTKIANSCGKSKKHRKHKSTKGHSKRKDKSNR